MKKYSLFSLLLLSLFSCKNAPTQEETTSSKDPIVETTKTIQAVTLDTIQTPDNYRKLDSEKGDLDKDGVDEMVIVYDTPRETDFGTEREIHIFKQEANSWKLWHKAVGAIMPSEHGGMMGDPFEGIDIENNTIITRHFGGSRSKWKYVHRFRFQGGKWELIGATIETFDSCALDTSFDYNLSTGKAFYLVKSENCETEKTKLITEEFFDKKMNQLPQLDGFQSGYNELIIPNTEITVHF